MNTEKKLEWLEQKVEILERRMNDCISNVSQLLYDCRLMERGIDELEYGFRSMQKDFDVLGKTFSSIEDDFDELEKKINSK